MIIILHVVTSVAVLVIYLVLPHERRGLALSFLPILRKSMAIFGARIVLNVRGVLTRNDHSSYISSIAFQTPSFRSNED